MMRCAPSTASDSVIPVMSAARPLFPEKRKSIHDLAMSQKANMYGPAARYKTDFQDRRTMLVNALRAHLAEFGIIAAQGLRNVGQLTAMVRDDDDTRLPDVARQVLQVLACQLEQIEAAITALERQLLTWHKTNAVSQRLASIPGIGPIIATAIATTVADPNVFRSGREFAAWLGLVPRQNGRKSPAGRHHQARQPLSASAAHQWSKRQSAPIEGDQSRSVDNRAASAAAAAGRSRSTGQQDGAYRLGGDAAPEGIPAPGCSGLVRLGRCWSLRE
jgi:hypothetical protein